MTRVNFLDSGKGICGFVISGHSTTGETDETGKLICASISSAAYMAVNTISDIIGDKIDTVINDGEMRAFVRFPSEATSVVLKGLRLHLVELSKEYSNNISIYGGAKHVKD